MRCVCGYEYDPEAKEERRESDGHGGAYTVGPTPFRAFSVQQGWGRDMPYGDLYVCPVCGTVRAE